MKDLFAGKRKLIAIPAVFFAIIAAAPLIIPALLALLVQKKVQNPKVKYGLFGILALIGLGGLPSYYAGASTVPVEQSALGEQVVAEKTAVPTLTAVPTTVPTAIPTKYIAPTNVPARVQLQPTTKPVQSEPAESAPVAPVYSGGDKDCEDFGSHSEAQQYFIAKGGSPSNNVDRLDKDGDGLACEDE